MGYVLSVEEAVKTAKAFESTDKKTWNMHLHLDGVNNIQKHICTQGRPQQVHRKKDKRENIRSGAAKATMESVVVTIYRNGAFESWRCYNCQRQGLIATECLFKQMGTRNVRELGEQGTEGQKEIHQK